MIIAGGRLSHACVLLVKKEYFLVLQMVNKI